MLILSLVICGTTSLFDVAAFRSMPFALRESGRLDTGEESVRNVVVDGAGSHPAVFLLGRLLSVNNPSNFHLPSFLA